MDYAQIILVGRATKDAERGEKCNSFTLAVTTNREKNQTSFFRIVGFGESWNVFQYVKKGTQLMVVGTPSIYKGEAKDGKTSEYFSVASNKLVLFGGKRDGGVQTVDMNALANEAF